MNAILQTLKDSVLHLFFPHICAGCGNDILTPQSQLCAKCIHKLPFTGFENHSPNPIEKNLSGRVRFQKATSQLYFNKESLVQRLMHQFKYRGNINLGRQLGVIMGTQLIESRRFNNIDFLVPLPLYENKLKQRGFNQSKVLCEGISEIMNIGIIEDAIERPLFTETQTKKNRVERWQNIEGKFNAKKSNKIEGRHVLLIDDVITTGATIESCASTLLNIKGVTLSIATLCCAINN